MLTRVEAVSGTVYGAGITIKELAAKTGFSPNYLYRISLAGPSGCDLTLGRADTLMEVTEIYLIIDYLCWRHGFLKVKPPRVAITKLGKPEVLEQLQTRCQNAWQNLDDFLSDMRDSRKTEIALYDLACLVEGIRKRMKKDWRQLELF